MSASEDSSPLSSMPRSRIDSDSSSNSSPPSDQSSGSTHSYPRGRELSSPNQYINYYTGKETSGVEKRADCTDQPLEYSNLIDTANIGETFSTIEF